MSDNEQPTEAQAYQKALGKALHRQFWPFSSVALQECTMHVSMHTEPAYDLDYSTLPNPVTPVPWEEFAELENSTDLLQRAAFWAFYAAYNADQYKDIIIALAARQDAHALAALGREMHMKDRIIIRQDTIAREYVSRERYNNAVTGASVWIALLGILAFIATVYR